MKTTKFKKDKKWPNKPFNARGVTGVFTSGNMQKTYVVNEDMLKFTGDYGYQKLFGHSCVAFSHKSHYGIHKDSARHAVKNNGDGTLTFAAYYHSSTLSGGFKVKPLITAKLGDHVDLRLWNANRVQCYSARKNGKYKEMYTHSRRPYTIKVKLTSFIDGPGDETLKHQSLTLLSYNGPYNPNIK